MLTALWRHALRVFAFVLLVSLIPTSSLWACSCAGKGPPCQMAWTAAAVFTGTVVEITEPRVPTINNESTTGRRMAADPAVSMPSPRRTVRFQVANVLTGVEPLQNEIEILTGLGGGDCGYAFQLGTAYVVYAYKGPEGLGTGICGRTRPLADAAEDLAYIRTARTAPLTGQIRVIAGPPFVTPLQGVSTALEGMGNRYVASTDAAGEARFDGMPPGKYKVTGTLEGYKSFQPTIELGSKGCAEVQVGMMLDRRIRGRVITKEGLPAAGVQLQVRSINRPIWESNGENVTADAEGNYEFGGFMESGGYYLGINLDRPATLENPYARWLFPGTENVAAATVIYFSEAPETKHYDLVLRERQKDRLIQGSVFTPDGRAASGARVSILDSRWLWHSPVAQVVADGNGRFLLHVLDGTQYRLHAVMGVPLFGTFSAEPVNVMPGDQSLDLKLVLTRSGDTIREDRQKGFGQR